MKLKDLIFTENKLGDLEIGGVTCDSRAVKEGYAFVCIVGAKSDGHDYYKNALESGASVIVTERDLNIDNQIIVEDSHAAYSLMCANWFSNPADKLKLIGVTGTNGKTSVTYMLKTILEANGEKVGLIGTIQNIINGEVFEAKNTTPDAFELNHMFAQMVECGTTCAVMEVSSHALEQCRVYNLNFEAAIFTNLTQDHLDYHLTMENYLEAKKKLFKMCKIAILNSDDEYYKEIAEGLDCKVVTYSAGDHSTYSAKAIKYKPASVDYEFVSDTHINHVKVNTGGKFTVYNSISALVCAVELGYPLDKSALSLLQLEGVKGRAEVVDCGKDFTVIIDYAHTPDGLKNILKTFRDCDHNRLTVLFGCGGDRDKTKRPIMGSIAARYADFVIVTSDNPRSENPSEIIKDIMVGMDGSPTPYKIIENRVEAIKYAIATAMKDDIIVLAGKGHETYQILSTGKIHLDEREVIAEALSEIN
ncbi:MAG: UDP-N-acetylmuramoyl-L-alanyl-D-glutamate--2,6-diaminopimelate ligase [Clostridia bacterium]|nr:UDP-N-acetylmuramoyl-L-alanyl-D-glutamate--2,6-diaminopimelate ligase [Clostridia bacterium]